MLVYVLLVITFCLLFSLVEWCTLTSLLKSYLSYIGWATSEYYIITCNAMKYPVMYKIIHIFTKQLLFLPYLQYKFVGLIIRMRIWGTLFYHYIIDDLIIQSCNNICMTMLNLRAIFLFVLNLNIKDSLMYTCL